MKLSAATHSNLPRVGDRPELQKLRRAYSGLEKGKISDGEFRAIQDELIKELIGIQESSGCEIVTDGMVRWYDHASHIAGHLKGFEINGLLRFFDTNYYYRQPVAGDNIAEGDGGLSEEAGFTVKSTRLPVKAVLLGPYSMARMSQNRSSMSFEKLSVKMAEILGAEIRKIASTKAEFIQIEEPAFAREQKDFDLFRDLITRLGQHRGIAKLILTFYFGNCTPLVDRLPDVPADMYGFDFTYSPGLLEKLKTDGFPKPVSFGILDGRNTRMESPGKIAKDLEGAIPRVNGEYCHITTSCGLEFLPREYAIKKLELTSKVVSQLNG